MSRKAIRTLSNGSWSRSLERDVDDALGALVTGLLTQHSVGSTIASSSQAVQVFRRYGRGTSRTFLYDHIDYQRSITQRRRTGRDAIALGSSGRARTHRQEVRLRHPEDAVDAYSAKLSDWLRRRLPGSFTREAIGAVSSRRVHVGNHVFGDAFLFESWV